MSQAAPRPSRSKPAISAAALCAAAAARAAAFHMLLPGVSAKADWAGCDQPGFNASARQQALLDAVEDAMDLGLADPNLMALDVADRLRCTDDDIVRSASNVGADGETGYFYEDFLYAVFAHRVQEADRAFNGLMDRLLQPASFGIRTNAGGAA